MEPYRGTPAARPSRCSLPVNGASDGRANCGPRSYEIMRRLAWCPGSGNRVFSGSSIICTLDVGVPPWAQCEIPYAMLPTAIPMNTERAATGTAIKCALCEACCCRQEVMLMGEDDVPLELTEVDRWGGQIMARLDDGWCAALDRHSMLCRIYERRPTVCREFQMGGSDCIAARSAARP